MMDDLPLSLVEHELGHLLGGILSGASSGVIKHDGFSWLVELDWPTKPPTEEQVVAPFLMGVRIRPEHASSEDTIMELAAPQHLKDAAAVLAIAVKEELDRLGPCWIETARQRMLASGKFALRRTMKVN